MPELEENLEAVCETVGKMAELYADLLVEVRELRERVESLGSAFNSQDIPLDPRTHNFKVVG